MKIRLAENFRALFYAPFYATQALGFYEREGVDINTQDIPTQMRALPIQRCEPLGRQLTLALHVVGEGRLGLLVCAPPCAGAVTGHGAKVAAEMSLVRETARLGDLAERHFRDEHEVAGVVHPLPDQVGPRRFTKGALERARKMRGAQSGDFAQLDDPDRPI